MKTPSRRVRTPRADVIKLIFPDVREHVHGPSVHQEHGVPPLRQGALLGDVPEIVLQRHLNFQDRHLPVPVLLLRVATGLRAARNC